MGWAGGSGVLVDVLGITYKHIPKAKRLGVCKKLIEMVEGDDCDTVPEAFDKRWPELEKAYYKLHPDFADDDGNAEE